MSIPKPTQADLERDAESDYIENRGAVTNRFVLQTWIRRAVAAEAALAESVPLEEAVQAVEAERFTVEEDDSAHHYNLAIKHAADSLRQLAARWGKGNGA